MTVKETEMIKLLTSDEETISVKKDVMMMMSGFVKDILEDEIERTANYLAITNLMELACAKVAQMLVDKTPKQIRSIFKVEGDLSPEELEKIKVENKWCEEV